MLYRGTHHPSSKSREYLRYSKPLIIRSLTVARSTEVAHSSQSGKHNTAPGECPKTNVHENAGLHNSASENLKPYVNAQVRERLNLRKKEVVDRLMAMVEECLERKLEMFEGPCDGEACSSRSHVPSNRSSGKSGNPSKRQSIGYKRQHRDDSGGNDSDHEDGNRRNGNNKRPKTVGEKAVSFKFACPYCKFDPDRYKQVKTCLGPGWEEFHRVK